MVTKNINNNIDFVLESFINTHVNQSNCIKNNFLYKPYSISKMYFYLPCFYLQLYLSMHGNVQEWKDQAFNKIKRVSRSIYCTPKMYKKHFCVNWIEMSAK